MHVSALRLGRWLAHYALRRRGALAVVISALLVKTALEVLKPWPMFVLVDHVLGGKELPAAVQKVVNHLPGAPARTKGGDRRAIA